MSVSSCWKSRLLGSALAGLAGSCWGGAVAWGQPSAWRMVSLHPPGAERSLAYDVWGGRQVGEATFVFYPQAVMWEGSAGSYLDLGFEFESVASGAHDGRVVGSYGGGITGDMTAVLWSEGESVVLTPAGARSAVAGALDAQQQVGAARFGDYRAGYWTGTAESWVELHPAGASESAATGVDEGQQAGYAVIDGADHAGVWRGTAGSWVDLHPAGASESRANDIHDGQQVGTARVDGSLRASMWHGSAASWVDLTPAGAQSSQAHGIYAGRQAGQTNHLGHVRAAVWSGSAESWEDLAPPLGSEWVSTGAFGIWSDETTIYVVGYGRKTTGEVQALMWTRPVDATCYADCDVSGGLDVFDFLCFQERFTAGDPLADCDENGVMDYFDFLCFQEAFIAGCR